MSHFYFDMLSDKMSDLRPAFEIVMSKEGVRSSKARCWYADPDTHDLVLFWHEPSDFQGAKPFPHDFDAAQVVAFIESYLKSLRKEDWGDMPGAPARPGFGLSSKDWGLHWGPPEKQYDGKYQGKFKSNYAFAVISLEWCEYHK